jgi:hypothetical protein
METMLFWITYNLSIGIICQDADDPNLKQNATTSNGFWNSVQVIVHMLDFFLYLVAPSQTLWMETCMTRPAAELFYLLTWPITVKSILFLQHFFEFVH